jgi:predicted nucleic acid-binding protein
LKKHRNRPISLADACLIRCADVYDEPRILTFDSNFAIYRWARNKAFRPL